MRVSALCECESLRAHCAARSRAVRWRALRVHTAPVVCCVPPTSGRTSRAIRAVRSHLHPLLELSWRIWREWRIAPFAPSWLWRATGGLCACGEARRRRATMPACAGAIDTHLAPCDARDAWPPAGLCTPGELETALGKAAAARPRSRRCSRSRQPACTCWRRCATRASRPRARTPSSLGRAVRRSRAALACPLACRAARAHDAARACGCCGMGR